MKIHRKFIQGLVLLALIMVAGIVHAQQGNGANGFKSVFDVKDKLHIQLWNEDEHSFLNEANPLQYDGSLYCITEDSVLVAKLLANGDYAEHWRQYENGDRKTPENLYLWTFVPKDFIRRCHMKDISSSQSPNELSKRLCQLLGLGTDTQRDTIVYMKVSKESLFRPAYITNVGELVVKGDNNKGKNDQINMLGGAERKWMAKQQFENNYPWTRMGYTYDWGGANEDYIGVAEFILKPNTGFDKFGFITINEIYNNVGVWPGNGQSNR